MFCDLFALEGKKLKDGKKSFAFIKSFFFGLFFFYSGLISKYSDFFHCESPFSFFFFLNNRERGNGNRCPVDNEILSEQEIYPDNFAKREILNCTVKCPNHKDGCKSVVTLTQLQA